MSGQARWARVRALAKINLGLKVLNKRPDGFHELRTIFQTVSLADTIEIEFVPGRRTSIHLNSEVEIPDNLVVRAAKLVMEAAEATGSVSFVLRKRIPMGAGLGGGSSDAAAVLLALPVLAGRFIGLEQLMELAAGLGSDVPFFLLGGTAIGLGRGTELYPLPDAESRPGLVVAPPVHVSTAEAYRALGRELTSGLTSRSINNFQALAWGTTGGPSVGSWTALCQNDFEDAVFGQHPLLRSLKKKLSRSGASPALLTGSGAALFGLFATKEDAERARASFGNETVFPISLVTRRQYRALWRRSLNTHIDDRTWPPRSRYVK